MSLQIAQVPTYDDTQNIDDTRSIDDTNNFDEGESIENLFNYILGTTNGAGSASKATRIIPPIDLSSIKNAVTHSINWTITEPAGTSIIIETSIDNGQTWQMCSNGDAIPNLPYDISDLTLLVRQTLFSNDVILTPTLESLYVVINGEVYTGIMGNNVIDLSDWQQDKIGLKHKYTDQDLSTPVGELPDDLLIESPVISGLDTYETQPIDLGAIISVFALVDTAGTNEPNTQRYFEIAYSDDDITYSDWELFSGGQYEARYFKFRVTFVSSGNKNILTKFIIELDAPEFSQREGNVTVPVGGLSITYDQGYKIVPALVITAIGDANARIVSQSETGFTVKVVDDVGTDIGGTINWQSTGY